MEQQGISAVVIEDKTGDKHNSLIDDTSVHTLAPVPEFVGKIAAGVAARASADFLVLARLEGLIVGLPEDEVHWRAQAYLEAGADGLVIHSKQATPGQVIRFAERIRRQYPEVLLVAIPTTYSHVPERDLRAAGFSVVIYANHMLRASVQAMTEVCRRILDHERALEAEELCVPPSRSSTCTATARWR
jgi:phosphoenolpyruvate phosphomutase